MKRIIWDQLERSTTEELENYLNLTSQKLGALEATLAFSRNLKQAERQEFLKTWRRRIPQKDILRVLIYKRNIAKLNTELKRRKDSEKK